MTFLSFFISYNACREIKNSIKPVDSFSVLSRPRGDRPARYPLIPALFYRCYTVLEIPVFIRHTVFSADCELLPLSYSLCCVLLFFPEPLCCYFTACKSPCVGAYVIDNLRRRQLFAMLLGT
jgi:hypothetical protein